MSGQCQGVSLAWHGWARLRKPLNVNTLETGGGPHTLMGTHSPAHTHTHTRADTQIWKIVEKREAGDLCCPLAVVVSGEKWPTMKRRSLPL